MGSEDDPEGDHRSSTDVAEASQADVDAVIAQLENRDAESEIIIS